MKQELAGVATLLALDLAWVAMNRGAWERLVKRIQGGVPMRANGWAGAAAYAAMVVGLIWIALPLARRARGNRVAKALRGGGVLGLVIYGVFDATNAAIFGAYDPWLAVTDVAWGTLVFTVSTLVALWF